MMQGAINGLFGIAEAYPELRAVESFKQLQAELSDTEDKIAAARRYYNSVVQRYNTRLQTLPDEPRSAGGLGFSAARVLPHRGRGRSRARPRVSCSAPLTLQEQIRANRLRTAIVLLGFGLLVAALVGGRRRALRARASRACSASRAIAYGVFVVLRSGKIIASASGAHPVTKAEQPELYRAVENAAIGAGLTRRRTCT